MTATDLDIPPNAKIVLPPHGFVALQESSASDLDVVNAARVSFAKQSVWGVSEVGGECLGETDEKVLRYLLKGKHGTPFEHNFFKFHVRAPIFIFREWHRHRIGISINEESARYSPLKGDFWYPDYDGGWRHQVGRPGAYTYEPMEMFEAESHEHAMAAVYDLAYATYQNMMDNGVAKEIARAVLPVGIYSQMIWSCNARSLMNFLALRNSPFALRELRMYAEAMEKIFSTIMPITHNAFVENNRIAP
jgi:thymidylate synthase (FAD)